MHILITIILSISAVTMICGCLIWFPFLALLVLVLRFYLQRRSKGLLPELRIPLPSGKKPVIVGFFHPYCNAGGGGERVLWCAIQALQKRYSHFRCVIYTGDTDATGDEILRNVAQRFNISMPRMGRQDIQFVFLHRRQWVEASLYPVFTLLGQSLGSLVLGMEALIKFIPDVYIDTMGYAFTLPLFRFLGGSNVTCYVHYPTISTDMLQLVSNRTMSYNNTSIISRSTFLSQVKLVYYKLFAFVYGMAGNCSSVIMVNSTWTYGHICTIWKAPDKTSIVYPPCNVEEFLKISLQDDSKLIQHSIISVGQFRPEKNHPLQIQSFAAFLDKISDNKKGCYKLVLVGGCRNAEDDKRVSNLKKLCEELGLSDNVDFRLNASFTELKKSLAESTIGLHTMWNEHFGIGVVECMAGGTIILAHDSGGPKLDIVKDFKNQKTGFLASDIASYSKAIYDILNLPADEKMSIRANARESVARFSDSEFEASFLSATENILSNV